MIFIYNNVGQVISTSRNLRGIHERNRRQRASHIEVMPLSTGEAMFSIKWPDGSWATTHFASYGVCVDHANNKRFASAEKNIHPRQILGSGS